MSAAQRYTPGTVAVDGVGSVLLHGLEFLALLLKAPGHVNFLGSAGLGFDLHNYRDLGGPFSSLRAEKNGLRSGTSWRVSEGRRADVESWDAYLTDHALLVGS